MLEKGKKFLNICLSTFLLLSIIFLFSVQNVKAEEETDTINPDEIQMSVDSLLTGISSKGFHPSKGNYLSIRAGVSFNTEQDLECTSINVRLRILNKSGKYVYEKTYKNIGGTNFWGDPVTSFDHKTIRLDWNGKPSKGNEAGKKPTAYTSNGTYKVELFYYVEKDQICIKSVTKTKSFKVSSKAPSGSKGLAASTTIPEYTGVDTVDYMAEKMIQSAKIKLTMSQDEKVRRIYHWMTVNFKHKHADEFVKAKNYYDLTSTKAQKRIKNYKKKTLQNYQNGKLIFGGSSWSSFMAPYMQKRGGVCSDQAAIFVILCNHVGVDAGVCNGYYKNLDGTRAGHSWNYAIVDGKKYYYDVDVEIQNYSKGQGDYYWYKKTLKQAKKNHIFQ